MCRFSFDCLTNVCTDEPRQDDESYAQLTSWDNDSTTYDNFDDGTACSDADDPGSLVCQPRQVCTLTFRIEVLRYFQCTAYPQEWKDTIHHSCSAIFASADACQGIYRSKMVTMLNKASSSSFICRRTCEQIGLKLRFWL